MVRNPYSRAYSAYKYSLRTEGNKPGSAVREGERVITFEEFLDESRCIKTTAGRRQFQWYDDEAKNFHVFRFEDLENSVRSIVRDIMKVPPKLAERVEAAMRARKDDRPNASTSRPDEWKEMSREARKRIERIYRRDFKIFGY